MTDGDLAFRIVLLGLHVALWDGIINRILIDRFTFLTF